MKNKILKLSKILFNLNLRKEASEISELINEGSPSRVDFSGILKLSPSNPPTGKQKDLSDSFKEHKLIPISAENLHITLLNQAVLKPLAKELKGRTFPEYKGTITYGDAFLVNREEKKSIFVVVNEQSEISSYISKALKEMGITEALKEKGITVKPEESRIYHISLANMTGNPHDSVGHSEAQPIILEDCTKI
jgi:hypothetical protein